MAKSKKEMTEEAIKSEAVNDFKKTQTFEIMEFAKQMQQIVLENMSTKNKIKFYSKYKPEQVDAYLADPSRYEKQLREVSRYLAVSSPQYWRLINYFPSIAVLCPIIVPFNTEKIMEKQDEKSIKKIAKAYHECTRKLDNMNVSHEFMKILQIIYREDVFYGYEIETDNSYCIKQLNPQYCRLKGTYDGSYTYEFDFSYFDSYDEIREYYNIDRDFLVKYNDFKNKGNDYRWQKLDLDREICIKYQETFDFCCPPYISVFNDLYDITDFKDMNKAKVEMDNTKFIGFDMETKKDKSGKLDDFLLDVETMKTYFAFIQSCLQGKIGTFMSPMPFHEIEFSSNKSEIDNVSNAIKSFWSATGVADVLVGENKNAGTLKYSINTDEALLFGAYKQIKRILSRKFKQISKGLFVVDLPDFTIFNVNSEFDKYLKASQYGYQGARTYAESALKMSQNVSLGLGFLENIVLKKQENMFPVSSSYTMTGEGEVGKPPETNDGNVSDSSQSTRDNATNSNK